MAVLNRTNQNNQQTLALYNYNGSTVGDVVGDTRTSNQSGWYCIDTCTVANAAKGAGTWIRTYAAITKSLVDNNNQYDGSTPALPTTAGAFLQLTNAKSGIGKIIIGDAQEYALFSFTTAGAVTLWTDASANVVTTNTDTKLCIYDGGTQVYIINELGGTLTCTVEVNYNV